MRRCRTCGTVAVMHTVRPPTCETCYGRSYREMVRQRRIDKRHAAQALADYMPEHMTRLRELGRV